MAGGTNPNGKGSGWVKALWITKKPVGEMAARWHKWPTSAFSGLEEDQVRVYFR
jgi:hypothetical protein